MVLGFFFCQCYQDLLGIGGWTAANRRYFLDLPLTNSGSVRKEVEQSLSHRSHWLGSRYKGAMIFYQFEYVY